VKVHPLLTAVLWCLAFYLALVVGAWNVAHG
jgi:hypothetical protein